MRSFQIYRQASPDDRKQIEHLEHRVARRLDAEAEAAAQYNEWRDKLRCASQELTVAENDLCDFLETLEKQMTQ